MILEWKVRFILLSFILCLKERKKKTVVQFFFRKFRAEYVSSLYFVKANCLCFRRTFDFDHVPFVRARKYLEERRKFVLAYYKPMII